MMPLEIRPNCDERCSDTDAPWDWRPSHGLTGNNRITSRLPTIHPEPDVGYPQAVIQVYGSHFCGSAVYAK
jgi:hypothetical protein